MAAKKSAPKKKGPKKKAPAEKRPHRGGNPPRLGVASDVRLGVLATSAERERWQAACDAKGTTLSAVARVAWNRLAEIVEAEADETRESRP